jgi:hypothetical protein
MNRLSQGCDSRTHLGDDRAENDCHPERAVAALQRKSIAQAHMRFGKQDPIRRCTDEGKGLVKRRHECARIEYSRDSKAKPIGAKPITVDRPGAFGPALLRRKGSFSDRPVRLMA